MTDPTSNSEPADVEATGATPDDTAHEIEQDAPTTETDNADALGEGGRKALRTERAARKAAEATVKEQAKSFEERISALETENAKLRAERFESRVEAIASHVLEHPKLAHRVADLHDGMTDQQITDALDEVIKAMPELARREQNNNVDSHMFTGVVNGHGADQHSANASAFKALMDSQLFR